METPRPPIIVRPTFGQHGLAVIGAAMLGALIFSVLFSGMAFATSDRPFTATEILLLAIICWLAVFLVALPSAGMAFSMLWPVTRRGTTAAGWVCLVTGATIGIVLAPIASPRFHGAGWSQLGVFGITGAAIGLIYVALLRRSSLRADHATAAPSPQDAEAARADDT